MSPEGPCKAVLPPSGAVKSWLARAQEGEPYRCCCDSTVSLSPWRYTDMAVCSFWRSSNTCVNFRLYLRRHIFSAMDSLTGFPNSLLPFPSTPYPTLARHCQFAVSLVFLSV